MRAAFTISNYRKQTTIYPFARFESQISLNADWFWVKSYKSDFYHLLYGIIALRFAVLCCKLDNSEIALSRWISNMKDPVLLKRDFFWQRNQSSVSI